MKKVILESKEDWLYMQLHMFKKGHISASHINDELIYELRDNGIIILKFDNNLEYFELFGFSDYTVQSLNSLFSYYNTSEWMDRYSAIEEWNEGYMYNYFNNENRELFNEIKEFLSPELDLENTEDIKKFSTLLNETFNDRVRSIMDDYCNEMDNAIEGTLKDEVKNDLCDIFMTDGIYHAGNGCFYKYYTTVDTLIKIYDMFDDKSSDVYNILKKLGGEKGIEDVNYDEWYEFDYQNNFDEQSFNRDVTWNLEKIKDELLNSDTFKNIEEYKKIKTYLSKYTFGVWFDLPKNKNIIFKIIGVNPATNYIIFEYKERKTHTIKKSEVSLDRFNLFLYHPELF